MPELDKLEETEVQEPGIGDSTEAASAEAKTQEWDKQKQRIDQVEANFRKISEERDTLQTTLESVNTKIDSLQKEIAVKEKQIDELDPNTADIPDVVRQNKVLIAELNQAKTRMDKLESLADTYAEKITEQEVSQRRSQAIEEILSPLDKEFGAKYRNKAKDMADKKVKETGEVPNDNFKAYLLLRDCYAQVKAEAESKESKSKSIPADDGSGGLAFGMAEVKSGRLKDVIADIKKRGLGK